MVQNTLVYLRFRYKRYMKAGERRTFIGILRGTEMRVALIKDF
jgi:hypothetical protein